MSLQDRTQYKLMASGGGDAAVTTRRAELKGVMVTVATATDVIEIENGSGGDVVLSIPASTGAGTYYECNNIDLISGIYVDFTGTGTIRVDYRLI